jgi:Ca2+-transporting ATPase
MDFYRMSTKEVISGLESRESGLSQAEVDDRIKKYGQNIFSIEKPPSFMKILSLQFNNFLVWLLILLALFAFAVGFYLNMQEQIIDGIIISIIIILNTFIGAFQDYSAEKSVQLIKNIMKNTALVLRSNKTESIASKDLVPGDIIMLKQGDKVPADCRILSSENLHVDESMLTGESLHVKKNPLLIMQEAPLADRKNMLYLNTFITVGEAKCMVTSTGISTEIGHIASLLRQDNDSPFVQEIDAASQKVTFIALGMIFFVVGILMWKDSNWVSAFMIGSALMIGSIPEGLPAIVTFALSIGARRLVKKNVLIKRRTLLETLGSIDVLCTDKTGTLTENKMSIKRVYIDNQSFAFDDKLKSQTLTEFSNAAVLSNEAKDTDKGFVGEAEDIALVNLIHSYNVDLLEIRNSYPTKRFEPFSSETKYSCSYNKHGGLIYKYYKGAPEIILKKCEKIMINGRIRKLNNSDKTKILSNVKIFSNDALRVIALSYVKGEKNDSGIFLGFVGLHDAPKPGIPETITNIYDAGIDVKMITGDNIETAVAIAKECGFRNIKAAGWNDIKDLSKEELCKTVEECNVFARMSPEYKLKIVNALQENGHRIAITGDGVNDAPSLKQSEVGIAMGNGADIAKDAGDLILLDNNIDNLYYAIREGRTIFSNVRKVINYLLTANFSEVFVIFICSIFGLVPFVAIQILWVNFVTDVLPAMSLALDPAHKNIMKKKPTGKGEKLINSRITYLTVFIGLKKTIIILALFMITYHYTNNLVLAQTLSFTWLVLSHFVRIVAIRYDEKMSLFINPYLNWALIVPIILQVIILYTFLAEYFHVVPIHWMYWLILISAFLLALGLAVLVTAIIDRNIVREDSDY